MSIVRSWEPVSNLNGGFKLSFPHEIGDKSNANTVEPLSTSDALMRVLARMGLALVFTSTRAESAAVAAFSQVVLSPEEDAAFDEWLANPPSTLTLTSHEVPVADASHLRSLAR